MVVLPAAIDRFHVTTALDSPSRRAPVISKTMPVKVLHSVCSRTSSARLIAALPAAVHRSQAPAQSPAAYASNSCCAAAFAASSVRGSADGGALAGEVGGALVELGCAPPATVLAGRLRIAYASAARLMATSAAAATMATARARDRRGGGGASLSRVNGCCSSGGVTDLG